MNITQSSPLWTKAMDNLPGGSEIHKITLYWEKSRSLDYKRDDDYLLVEYQNSGRNFATRMRARALRNALYQDKAVKRP